MPPARPLLHRLSCLAACVALVKRCVTMYSTLPASHHVTGPLRDLLALHLSRSGYPLELQVRTGPRPDTRVGGPVQGAPLHVGVLGTQSAPPPRRLLFSPQALCQSALAEMDSQKQSYRPMVCERTRPQPPKLFTPRLVRV